MDIIEKLISLPPVVIYNGEEYQLNIINEGSKELRIFYAPGDSWGVDETLIFFEAIENKEDLDWAVKRAYMKLIELEVQVTEVGSGRPIPIRDIVPETGFFSSKTASATQPRTAF
jgi:hypothetical protein